VNTLLEHFKSAKQEKISGKKNKKIDLEENIKIDIKKSQNDHTIKFY
jgi:hypothetical protein